MRLGTTPSHTFSLPFGREKIEEMKVTYEQDKKVILEKYLEDFIFNDTEATYRLTQEETFLFKQNINARIQVRIKIVSGEVMASDLITVTCDQCLDKEVL